MSPQHPPSPRTTSCTISFCGLFLCCAAYFWRFEGSLLNFSYLGLRDWPAVLDWIVFNCPHAFIFVLSNRCLCDPPDWRSFRFDDLGQLINAAQTRSLGPPFWPSPPRGTESIYHGGLFWTRAFVPGVKDKTKSRWRSRTIRSHQRQHWFNLITYFLRRFVFRLTG